MEIIRDPSEKVHPSLGGKWLNTYEEYVTRHPGEPLESAAAFADATWEGVPPRENGKIPGSAAVRVASVMLCETKKVPTLAAFAVESWEQKAGRAASPEEIGAILAQAGIDPLLSKAQRTIPGAGLPAEQAPAATDAPPAPKKRGRPPKAAGLAAAAPAKPKPPDASPVGPYNERDKRLEKTFKDRRAMAEQIASVLAGVRSVERGSLVALAIAIAKMHDEQDQVKSLLWSGE